tara:strand:- start:37 stop:540 length:504 start_codon:yes stop_codon:yes gene_type:complete
MPNSDTSSIIIRKANPDDMDAIWAIFKKVTEKGDTYIYDSTTTLEDAKHILVYDAALYVATKDEKVVGLYVIRQNKVGRGSHVCNAAYMVDPDAQGNGIGKLMGEHSLDEAKLLGYKAMQFNIVVSTNKPAVHLWKKLGFNIVGTIPEAFNHKELGLVDAYVMHRFL